MTDKSFSGVLPLPTSTTKILETLEVPTKIRTHDAPTHGAKIILKIRINLDLTRDVVSHDSHVIGLTYFFGKIWRLYFDETGFDGFHVTLLVTESDTPTTDRVFVLIGIYPGIDHTPKQVINDMSQRV